MKLWGWGPQHPQPEMYQVPGRGAQGPGGCASILEPICPLCCPHPSLDQACLPQRESSPGGPSVGSVKERLQEPWPGMDHGPGGLLKSLMPKRKTVCFSGERAVATWALHSPKSLEHICSMSPSALCSISHWAQILVTEERSRGRVRGSEAKEPDLGFRLPH